MAEMKTAQQCSPPNRRTPSAPGGWWLPTFALETMDIKVKYSRLVVLAFIASATCSCAVVGSRRGSAPVNSWGVYCTVAPLTEEKRNGYLRDSPLWRNNTNSAPRYDYEITLTVRDPDDPMFQTACSMTILTTVDRPAIIDFPYRDFVSGPEVKHKMIKALEDRQSGAITVAVTRVHGTLVTTVSGDIRVDNRSVWNNSFRVETPEEAGEQGAPEERPPATGGRL